MSALKQIKVSELVKAAKKHKTPFYYYSSAVIKANLAALKKCLPKRFKVFYAAKANPNVEILKLYRKAGALAECASAGEMLACIKAGYKNAEIALSGPVKTDVEFDVIRKNRPVMVHAETADEIAALDRLGVKLNVALRINLEIKISTRGAILMTGGNDKFGFDPAEAKKIVKERGRYKNIEISGFHIYMGTQIRSANAWLKGAGKFLDWTAETSRRLGYAPSYINFGGGLGVSYGDNRLAFDLKKFKSGLARMKQKSLLIKELSGATFYIEPGRFLAAPTGVYVMRVTGVKKIRGRRYVLTDGGIHHALFPFRVSREFPVRLINRSPRTKKIKQVLGGPLCTTLDQSDLPVSLPELKQGDLLGIYQSGSYGFSAGMHYFLSHPMPAEILGDGKKIFLIRKPSATEHLFRNQLKREL